MPAMGLTYLVTGGAGFIGSHLVDALVERGARVVVLDDLSSGDLANLRHARSLGAEVVTGSVLDAPLVDRLVASADVAAHLAAPVGVQLVVRHPLRTFTETVDGARNVIEAAARHRRKLMVTSSSEVYGDGNGGPLLESDSRVVGTPSAPRSAYSAAKAAVETLAFVHHLEADLPVVVARLFNTAGPRQRGDHGMVVPRMVAQALSARPVTVFGDGTQSRCFCHVADAVGALMLLLEDPGAVGGVFNVGSSDEVTILELARRVVARAESSAGIVLVPYEQAYAEGFEDMRRRVPDTTRVRQLTGWAPSRDLDHVLDDVVSEMRAERAAAGLAAATSGGDALTPAW
jgi:UDP-glucose 4-epimerase